MLVIPRTFRRHLHTPLQVGLGLVILPPDAMEVDALTSDLKVFWPMESAATGFQRHSSVCHHVVGRGIRRMYYVLDMFYCRLSCSGRRGSIYCSHKS